MGFGSSGHSLDPPLSRRTKAPHVFLPNYRDWRMHGSTTTSGRDPANASGPDPGVRIRRRCVVGQRAEAVGLVRLRLHLGLGLRARQEELQGLLHVSARFPQSELRFGVGEAHVHQLLGFGHGLQAGPSQLCTAGNLEETCCHDEANAAVTQAPSKHLHVQTSDGRRMGAADFCFSAEVVARCPRAAVESLTSRYLRRYRSDLATKKRLYWPSPNRAHNSKARSSNRCA